MPTDPECAVFSARLEDAFWAKTAPDARAAEHAARCGDCRTLQRELESIAESLAMPAVPVVPELRAASIRVMAARELANAAFESRPVSPLSRPSLPSGFSRELARILGWALLPLPLVLITYVQLFQLGRDLLGQVLPDWGVLTIGIAAASVTASWLAAVYGAIPLVAYRRSFSAASQLNRQTS